jgi:hypothetical protein
VSVQFEEAIAIIVLHEGDKQTKQKQYLEVWIKKKRIRMEQSDAIFIFTFVAKAKNKYRKLRNKNESRCYQKQIQTEYYANTERCIYWPESREPLNHAKKKT